MPGANKTKNCHLICNGFSLVPPSSATVVTDTSCTSLCFKLDTTCNKKKPVRDGLRVGLPNGTSIQATHTGLLPADCPLPPLLTNACRVSLFPGLTSKALISIGNFFDDGYSAVFTAHIVRLVKYDASAVVVHRNRSNCLWYIAITASAPPSNPPFLKRMSTAPKKNEHARRSGHLFAPRLF